MNEHAVQYWHRLRSASSSDGVLEVSSIASTVETGYGPVRFALGPDDQPRMLVPCSTASAFRGNLSSTRLTVALSRLSVAGKNTLFIDLMSVERSLDPVFAELATEVLRRVARGISPSHSVETTIYDFRALLIEGPSQLISDQEIVGLVGELIVLRMLVKTSPTAIQAWTGPYDQRHDYRRDLDALEVKTSTRSDASLVHISSIDQLSSPAAGTLTLIHVRVERSSAGSFSVSSLSAGILESGTSPKALADALKEVGCLDASAEEWNRLRFNLEGMTGYSVVEGFPRITGNQFITGCVPRGLSSITYIVDLSFAEAFQMSGTQLKNSLENIAR